MRILIIANHLLDGRIASGGDRIFVEMAKRWGKWGAQMTLIAPEVGVDNVASEIGAENTVVISPSPFDNLQQKAIWAILPLYLYRTFKAFGFLKEVEVDVLYTTGDFFCNVIPAFYLKKKLKVRWIANIYHINESPFVRKGNSFLASMVSYILQRFSFLLLKGNADIIFLNNRKVKNCLVGMGFDGQKLFVTGLGGVDLKKYKIQNAKVRERRFPESSKNFEGIFLGRLNPTKGIFDLPKVWRRVVEKVPEAKLVMIGGGEKWLGELRARIQGLGLGENIKIAGFVSEEEKLKLLSQSKVFVFPSYEEGWGMAVAEAMAAGLPVVAYDLPVYKEIFPKAFLTVEIGDVDAMSKSVLKLLQDENEHKLWQKRGHDVVQKYDLDEIAKRQWGILSSSLPSDRR